jgi:hypothetical protein
MPPRFSADFPDHGYDNKGGMRANTKEERIYHFLFVTHTLVHIVYSFAIGAALVCLPWQEFWGNNLLLYRFPGLRPLVGNPFVKGAVLGLGIVNLLIGMQETARLRKSDMVGPSH